MAQQAVSAASFEKSPVSEEKNVSQENETDII
jgi:hypothetical protein